jgi:hypothetical protein
MTASQLPLLVFGQTGQRLVHPGPVSRPVIGLGRALLREPPAMPLGARPGRRRPGARPGTCSRRGRRSDRSRSIQRATPMILRAVEQVHQRAAQAT